MQGRSACYQTFVEEHKGRQHRIEKNDAVEHPSNHNLNRDQILTDVHIV